jgi:hypothetical protein
MGGPLDDEEEAKDQAIVNMQLAPFKYGATKVTLFFSTHDPYHVLKQLIIKLQDRDITFQEDGLKKGKLAYTKFCEQDEDEKERQEPEVSCKV